MPSGLSAPPPFAQLVAVYLASPTSASASGVTLFDPAEAGDEPDVFVAVAVKVYATPLVKPVIVHTRPFVFGAVALFISHVAPPGEAVTVNLSAASPVVADGTATVAEVSPAWAIGAPGALGAAVAAET